MPRCIYKIINVVNNKFYVGSAVSFAKRKRMHLWKLRRGDHANKHLQAAWAKYGEAAFIFVVVQHVAEMVDILEEENVWLRMHVGAENCYNVAESATAFGTGKSGDKNPMWGRTFTHTEAARAKIAEAGRGRFVTAETRAKRSAALKGREISTAQRMQISRTLSGAGNFWYGKERPDSFKEKIRKAVDVTTADGVTTRYESIQALRAALGLKPPTVNRALKDGKILARGPFKGWSFKYVAPPTAA